ncbi:4445_t:CDS:1, partial [Diversispora eburnea]
MYNTTFFSHVSPSTSPTFPPNFSHNEVSPEVPLEEVLEIEPFDQVPLEEVCEIEPFYQNSTLEDIPSNELNEGVLLYPIATE